MGRAFRASIAGPLKSRADKWVGVRSSLYNDMPADDKAGSDSLFVYDAEPVFEYDKRRE